MRFAAVEGGGTSWVVAIVENEVDNFIEVAEFPTQDPQSTLSSIRQWLRERAPFDAIGVATFGPVDARVTSSTYGFITTTPKTGWKNTDVIGLLGLKEEFANVPFLFDTDVNAPALAEFSLHNTSNATSCAYITVGTGVGVGLVVNGKSVKGLLHPEAGHLLVQKQKDDTFEGTCPFHGSCVEGMCSTNSLAKRRGVQPGDLPSLSDDDSVWDSLSFYLGQLCANLILIASPESIVIGGGVLNRSVIFSKVRSHTQAILNGYISSDMISSNIDQYIRPSFWGNKAGIVGAAYLAHLAFTTVETNEIIAPSI